MPATDFAATASVLIALLRRHQDRFTVKEDSPVSYSVNTRIPSPFPQHKGQPLWFGAVQTGKAYVSFHLMPIYMCPELSSGIAPGLKKHMQGKSCFSFRTVPAPEILRQLEALTDAAVNLWTERRWM